MLAVYSGSALDALTSLQCNDDGLPGLLSEVTFLAIADTTYYFQAGGFRGDTGELLLNVFLAP